MHRLLVAFSALLLCAVSAHAQTKNPVVLVETSMGNFKIELYPEKAPETVKNFLGYVDRKFYDGTIVHRVVAKFIVQGGGFEPGMKKKEPGPAIKSEAGNGLKNTRGTVAMARGDKADSATCQFFVNVRDNPILDKDKADDGIGYCVFGFVTEGLDVVDKIAAVETTDRDDADGIPVKDVIIKSIRRLDK